MPKPQCEVDLAVFCAAFDTHMRVTPQNEISPDYELDSLRLEGDQLFEARDYVGAIDLYSKCLATKPQIPATYEQTNARQRCLLLTYASRSETWIWLQKYDNAFNDAVKALELDPTHAKSLHCHGRALHALEKYDQACVSFRTALRVSPDDECIKESLTRAKIAHQQSQDGVYDLEEFLLAGCQGPAPSCSDFVGPVEIQYVPNAGRGLVVNADVDAGQLLLVSNALSVACSPTEFWSETRITKANHDFLVTELADLVQNSKRRLAQLSTLGSHPDEVMEIPEMDIFLPEIDWAWAEAANKRLDSTRLSGIIRTNAFDALKCIDPIPFGDIETESNTGSGAGIASSGIWVLPSFINHSCVSNCNMMFIGNAMFIRASRDIAAGQQLTLSYCDPYEPEEYRQDTLKWWKFECKCERCTLEQTFESQVPRGRLFPNFFSVFEKLVAEEPLMKIFKAHCKMAENGEVHELPGIVVAVEDLIQSSVTKLDTKRQNWLRAPLIAAYTGCILLHTEDLPKKIEAVERALEIMTEVRGGDLVAMQISSTLLRDTQQLHGEEHEQYKQTEARVIDICKATLGRHCKDFFHALIDARFNSSNQAFG